MSADSTRIAYIANSFARAPEVWGRASRLRRFSLRRDQCRDTEYRCDHPLQRHPSNPPGARPIESITWTSAVQPSPTIPPRNRPSRLQRAGLAPLSRRLRSRQEIPPHRLRSRRPILGDPPPLAGSRLRPRAFRGAWLLRADAEPARQLRARARRSTQANRKDFGYGDLRDILAGVDAVTKSHSIDPERVGLTGWVLWRIHDHVRRHPDEPIPRRRRRGRHLRLAELLRRKRHRPVDDPFLRRIRLRRSREFTPKCRPSISSRTSKHRPSPSSATATANAPLRSPSSSGTRSRPSTFRRNWWSIPTKATASADPEHRSDVIARALDWFQKYMPAD